MKLNCDMGESFGHWSLGSDKKIMPYVNMANIACGFHASDPMTMAKTVALACEYKVSIGAHPGYPDLEGFGRREMALSSEELTNSVLYQVGALQAICHAQGAKVDYVKPHGAMYNAMMRDDAILLAILKAVACLSISSSQKKISLMVLANDKAEHIKHLAGQMNVPLVFEAFSDRAYDDQGNLVPRSTEGSVLNNDEMIEQQIRHLIKYQKVISFSGKTIPIVADTICVHGDNERALESVKKIRSLIRLL